MTINSLARRLIDRFQHGLPLCAEPYQAMAEALGCSETQVIDCLHHLHVAGTLSRVGPVFEHTQIGRAHV